MAAITAEELLDLEREGWDALVAGTGGDYYRDAMTEDAVMFGPGFLVDRDAIAESLAGTGWDEYELAEPRRVDLGPDAAALVYRARARRGSSEVELRMTTSYRRVGGRWLVALHQQSPL